MQAKWNDEYFTTRNGKTAPRLFVFPVALDPTEERAALIPCDANIFHLSSSNGFDLKRKVYREMVYDNSNDQMSFPGLYFAYCAPLHSAAA